MTTQNQHSIQLGALSYELLIAVQSVAAGVEMIARRPDVPAAMREPLAILENLSGRAREAAVILQDEIFAAFGLTPLAQDPANDDGV